MSLGPLQHHTLLTPGITAPTRALCSWRFASPASAAPTGSCSIPLCSLQINKQTQKHLKSAHSPPTSTPCAHAVLGCAHPQLAQPAAPQPDYKRLRNDITVNLARKPADFVQNVEQLIVAGGGAGRKGGADGIKLGSRGRGHPSWHTAQPRSGARLHLLPPAAGFKGTSPRLTRPLRVIARVGFH